MTNLIQVHDLQPNDLRDLIRSVMVEVMPAVAPAPQVEIIDQDELCKRLRITRQTARFWSDKGRIPRMRVGTQVRYNWHAVVAALEDKPRK